MKKNDIIICLQCGYNFPLVNVYNDDKGYFTVCTSCEGSFDIDYDEGV